MVDAPPKLIQDLVDLMAESAIELKKSPQDLAWPHFKEWLVDSKAADKTIVTKIQKALQSVGGFPAVRDSFFPPVNTPTTLERFDLKNRSATNRRQLRLDASEVLDNQHFEEILARQLPKINVSIGKLPKQDNKPIERGVVLFLSDTHVGARLDPREVMKAYGPVETARRFSKILQNVLKYKMDHREETECHLFLGGDMIQGMLGHDPRDGAPLTDQWCEAYNILIQFISWLAKSFKKVTVYCTTGNHDRDTARHPDKATHSRHDSHATKLYYALLKHFEVVTPGHVSFQIPRTAWVDVEILGHRVYLFHGDTNNMSPGNPGSTINVKQLVSKMNSINIGEVQAGRKPFKVFVVGHIHFGGLMQVPGGYFLVTNPALIHKDEFSLGFGHGQAMGQCMWEMTRKYGMGDFRIIEVSFDDDVDKSLDLIKSYEDY